MIKLVKSHANLWQTPAFRLQNRICHLFDLQQSKVIFKLLLLRHHGRILIINFNKPVSVGGKWKQVASPLWQPFTTLISRIGLDSKVKRFNVCIIKFLRDPTLIIRYKGSLHQQLNRAIIVHWSCLWSIVPNGELTLPCKVLIAYRYVNGHKGCREWLFTLLGNFVAHKIITVRISDEVLR